MSLTSALLNIINVSKLLVSRTNVLFLGVLFIICVYEQVFHV